VGLERFAFPIAIDLDVVHGGIPRAPLTPMPRDRLNEGLLSPYEARRPVIEEQADHASLAERFNRDGDAALDRANQSLADMRLFPEGDPIRETFDRNARRSADQAMELYRQAEDHDALSRGEAPPSYFQRGPDNTEIKNDPIDISSSRTDTSASERTELDEDVGAEESDVELEV
jgi:hypothetical protein